MKAHKALIHAKSISYHVVYFVLLFFLPLTPQKDCNFRYLYLPYPICDFPIACRSEATRTIPKSHSLSIYIYFDLSIDPRLSFLPSYALPRKCAAKYLFMPKPLTRSTPNSCLSWASQMIWRPSLGSCSLCALMCAQSAFTT